MENIDLEPLENQVRKFLDRCSVIKQKLSQAEIEANSVAERQEFAFKNSGGFK